MKKAYNDQNKVLTITITKTFRNQEKTYET